MDIRVEQEGESYSIALSGGISDSTIGKLSKEFDKLARADVKRILLDLSGVSDINSAGIDELIRFYRMCDESNGATVEIVGVSDFLFELFSVLKLDALIKVRKDN